MCILKTLSSLFHLWMRTNEISDETAINIYIESFLIVIDHFSQNWISLAGSRKWSVVSRFVAHMRWHRASVAESLWHPLAFFVSELMALFVFGNTAVHKSILIDERHFFRRRVVIVTADLLESFENANPRLAFQKNALHRELDQILTSQRTVVD